MTSRERAAYLQAFRQEVATPASAAADNRAAIADRIARGEVVSTSGPARSEPDDAADPDVATGGWSQRAAGLMLIAKPVALSVGIATAGLGAVKGGSMTWHALRDKPAAYAEIDEAPALATSSPRPPLRSRARPPGEPAPAAAPVPEHVAPPQLAPQTREASTAAALPSMSATSPVAHRPPMPTQVAVVPEDRLRQETALMQRAKMQLERQAWDELLQSLAQHAQQFPSGVLRPERGAWSTIARCRLGRGEGSKLLDGFMEQFPGSALTTKVRRACVGGQR